MFLLLYQSTDELPSFLFLSSSTRNIGSLQRPKITFTNLDFFNSFSSENKNKFGIMTITLIKATNKFRNFLQMTVWKYNFQVDNFSTGSVSWTALTWSMAFSNGNQPTALLVAVFYIRGLWWRRQPKYLKI